MKFAPSGAAGHANALMDTAKSRMNIAEIREISILTAVFLN